MTDIPYFIDANVLLETTLQNRRHANLAQAFVEANTVILSPLSAHLYIYFGKKDGISVDFLCRVLERHAFTSCGAEEVRWAMQNRQGEDFEDALQVACAVLHGCQEFVTFDKQLTQRYGQFIDMRLLEVPNHSSD